MTEPVVVWKPTDRQADFLASDDFEVLYGGAAGGGKSDALLVDAMCLQHNGVFNKNHRAVLFRRSFPELKDLIDRSIDIFQEVDAGAEYNKVEKVWTFSSGAKIEFGYLGHDNDRFKYRGRAWNYIGFDELTLWATNICYLYLFSRCRSVDKSLPRYIRATTNPDGAGQKWVMQRWGIDEDGGATRIPVDLIDEELGQVTTYHRTFIPARLSDNIHLSGTGYREALLQLEKDDREALLAGKWKQRSVRGAYYFNEMAKLRQEGRIRRVPHEAGFPVYTFWDLGMNDTTAIWFAQYIAGEWRFIHCYENSGEDLAHYVQYLTERGYSYHSHFLPHDAGNLSLHTKKTTQEMLEILMPSQAFHIVPRTQNTLIAINQTRLRMKGNVYICESECVDGIVALDHYRKKYNDKLEAYTDEPLHDRYSNYADAFRQWAQALDEGLVSVGSISTGLDRSRRRTNSRV